MEESSLAMKLEALGMPLAQPKGAVLFDQGQPGTGAYILKSGAACLALLNHQGAPVWSRVVRPGAILGLPSTIGDTPYSLRATALESVELVFIPKRQVMEVMRQDPTLGTALLRILSDELVDLRRKLSLLRLQSPSVSAYCS